MTLVFPNRMEFTDDSIFLLFFLAMNKKPSKRL